MKGRTGFILFIAVFLLLIYWVEVSKPKSFDWRVTYKPESGEPFGCKLFDEMMSKTMPKGYKVTSRDLQSLALDSTEMGNNNILLLSEDNALHSSFSERLDAIYTLLRAGCNVMVAQDNFASLTEELDIDRSDWMWKDFTNFARKGNIFIHDTLMWKAPTTGYPTRTYTLHQLLSGNTMVVSSDKWQKLIYKREGVLPYGYDVEDDQDDDDEEDMTRIEREDSVVFMRRKIGNGYLYLLTAPELLSNYSITHDHTANLALRIMNELSDKPTIKTTAYLPKETGVDGTISSLSYIASKSPLLLAYRLSLLAILLFFIFNAKRRQRIIRVVPEPVNHQLEYVKQIGTLYYQKGDHADMVLKKFKYLKERLRREVQIDISEPSGDEESLPQLSALTGYSQHHLKTVISWLRVLERQQHPYLTVEEMTKHIDEINNIYNSIN